MSFYEHGLTLFCVFTVVYHHGHSASGGHYTLDVLHPNRFSNVQHASTSPSPSSPGSDKQKLPNTRVPTIANLNPKPSDEVDRDCDHDPREGWIRIDDELVSDVRPEDVLGCGESGLSEEGRCAYLLFYRRRG